MQPRPIITALPSGYSLLEPAHFSKQAPMRKSIMEEVASHLALPSSCATQGLQAVQEGRTLHARQFPWEEKLLGADQRLPSGLLGYLWVAWERGMPQ